MTACPLVGSISVERIRKSVVLPLPLGPRSPNSSALRTSKADAIERSTVIVAVNEILNADNGTGARAYSGAGRGFVEDWDFTGHRLFYTVILRRYGVEHHEGEQKW